MSEDVRLSNEKNEDNGETTEVTSIPVTSIPSNNVSGVVNESVVGDNINLESETVSVTELKENLYRLNVELNFMHGENDKIRQENKQKIDEVTSDAEEKILQLEEKLAATVLKYEDRCREVNELEVNYKSKCGLSNSTEVAQSALQVLLADKDALIQSQKGIINRNQEGGNESLSLNNCYKEQGIGRT